MQQNTQAKPLSVDADVPKRTFKVEANGNVTMVEVTTTTVVFPGREFITFVRNHDNDLTSLENQLGDDHKKKLVKSKKALETEIKRLKPLADDVLKKLKETYELEQKKSFIANIKQQLNNKDTKKALVAAMWNTIREEKQKNEVLDELTKEEKIKLLKITNNATKENRGK